MTGGGGRGWGSVGLFFFLLNILFSANLSWGVHRKNWLQEKIMNCYCNCIRDDCLQCLKQHESVGKNLSQQLHWKIQRCITSKMQLISNGNNNNNYSVLFPKHDPLQHREVEVLKTRVSNNLWQWCIYFFLSLDIDKQTLDKNKIYIWRLAEKFCFKQYKKF